MTAKANNSLADRIADVARAHSREGLEEFFDRKIMTRQQFRKVVLLAKEALEELFADSPNEKRMARKLKEAAMVYLDLDIERQVEDQIQMQAVKLLRENVIRRADKEKLAEGAAEMAAARWRGISEDDLETLTDDDDGALTVILRRTEMRMDSHDDELNKALTETGRILAMPFVEALGDDTLRELVRGAIEIISLTENGRPAAEKMQQTATLALDKLGVIRIMRKSFAGLLLGDMILRQAGKSLGIKEKVSVTDFIIFLGCLIADKQALPKVPREELKQIKAELEAL